MKNTIEKFSRTGVKLLVSELRCNAILCARYIFYTFLVLKEVKWAKKNNIIGLIRDKKTYREHTGTQVHETPVELGP